MNRRIALLAAAALVTAVGFVGLTGSSSATFVSSSANPSTVQAAVDWTPPVVAIRAPAPAARGTLTIEVEASDAETGIVAVELQRRPVGGTWRTLGTTQSAPFTFEWDTAGGADGTHELRAVATDGAGHRSTSEVVRVAVVNDTTVALTYPGALLRGEVSLSATVTAAGSAAWAVRFEASPAGSDDWKALSPAVASPYAWAWKTALGADGRYDLRVVATSGSLRIVAGLAGNVLVDNTAPTVSLSLPTGTLTGVITASTTADDALSGLASVVVQSAPSADGPWTELARTSAAATGHQIDTSTLPDGQRWFRAVATDRVGNQSFSAVVGPRQIENLASASVSLENPGGRVSGVVALRATASSTLPIAQLRFQRAPTKTEHWTTIGTVTKEPWEVAWDTRDVANGLYDLRVVLTDSRGNQTTSKVMSSRTVENVAIPFLGVDVQTTNAGTLGLVESGDSLAFTFSRAVDLTSISPGWDGTDLPIQMHIDEPRFGDNRWTDDDVTFSRPGSTLNLGRVRVPSNLLETLVDHATFNATLGATTELSDGLARTVVTVTVGDLVKGRVRVTHDTATMLWHPADGIRSLSGQTLPTSPVAELGPLDKDF